MFELGQRRVMLSQTGTATTCRSSRPHAGVKLAVAYAPVSDSVAREARTTDNIGWLISARWAALGAQGLSVLAAYVLADVLPTNPQVVIFALSLGAATNVAVAYARQSRRFSATATTSVLIAIDIGLLTVLLAASGGAMNPLSILYLAYITLAAVLLPPSATWIAAAVSTVCFGGLVFRPWQRDLLMATDMASHIVTMRLHAQGMWWSFLMTAGMTSFFGVRLAERLDQQAAKLAAAREEAVRHQRLASLATLAAGAAHELSSPLATIAVVADELERTLRTFDNAPALLDDVNLIRQELTRCRATLDRLSTDAGQSSGEAVRALSAADVAMNALCLLKPSERDRVRLGGDVEIRLLAPPAALGQALSNLLRNAIDATSDSQLIHLSVQKIDGRRVAFVVRDSGSGMSSEIAERVGEPFFTTKVPTKGMGLGVFLSRAIVEQLGGHLRLYSRLGEGTTVTIELPTRS